MADIVTVNTTDKTLILAARQGFRRRTTIGSSWTDVRMGMFFTVVPTSNDDAACQVESVTRLATPDDFTFGLTDHLSTGLYNSGAKFLGFRQSGNFNISGNNSAGSATMNGSYVALGINNGSEIFAGGYSQNTSFPQFSTGVGCNGFWSLRFVVSNLGLSSQFVTLHFILSSFTATDVSDTALRDKLLTSFYTSSGQNITFNTGAAAIPLPDCFWIRLPTFNNRLRITAYGITKIS